MATTAPATTNTARVAVTRRFHTVTTSTTSTVRTAMPCTASITTSTDTRGERRRDRDPPVTARHTPRDRRTRRHDRAVAGHVRWSAHDSGFAERSLMTITIDELVGAWTLSTAVEVFTDGQRRPEFGPSHRHRPVHRLAGETATASHPHRRQRTAHHRVPQNCAGRTHLQQRTGLDPTG